MSLAAYLAKNYLTADPGTAPPPKHSKKRKRKDRDAGAPEGFTIADDSADIDASWNSTLRADGEGNDPDAPTIVTGNSSEFRKTKKSNWTTVGGSGTLDSSADQAAADEILAKTAAENQARNAVEETDDAPQIVDTADDDAAYMESGAKAGLQTAAQVTEALERRQRAERRRERTDATATGKDQETVYRDATGRIVNVAMQRAEARRAEQDAAARAAQEADAARGDVQRAYRDERRRQVADAAYHGVARYADDAEMNEELKARERWNDPAAQFVARRQDGASVTGRPLYKGAAPPNRYGIRPGHRWDGVDRGNAFEKEYFAAQNRRQNTAQLEYAWQMDE